MELDGLLGDPELLRDRLVRKTTRDRTDDPELTFGQPGILCGSFTRVLEVLGTLAPEYRARPECVEFLDLVTRARDLTVKELTGKQEGR